jgi:acetyl esterase
MPTRAVSTASAAAITQPDPPAVGEVRDLHAAGPRGARPAAAVPAGRAPGRTAVLVYFHGGGWVIGDLDTHDVVCRQLCRDSGCAVVAVDYRMGPEHRFPAAPDDALAAVRWVRAQAAALGLDATRSPGRRQRRRQPGGRRRHRHAQRGRGAGLAAAADLPGHRHARRGAFAHAQRPGLCADQRHHRLFPRHYTPQPAQWEDWRASPLLADDLSHLPPALVLTAGFDPLRDEGRQYADALSAAGVQAQYVCFERQIHGFITMGRVIDEAHTALDLCAAALRRVL